MGRTRRLSFEVMSGRCAATSQRLEKQADRPEFFGDKDPGLDFVRGAAGSCIGSFIEAGRHVLC